MQQKMGRLTDARALAFPAPTKGYVIHWCPETPGFGVRVTAAGGQAWVSERRINGKTVRRTLGPAGKSRGAISCKAARDLLTVVSSELLNGVDRAETRKAERVERKREQEQDDNTLSVALKAYVKAKRRSKDGKPLKARTVTDYVAMVEGNRTDKNGKPLADGELFALADTPLTKITAGAIRGVHEAAAKRGKRRAAYAMQVLRAVLRWNGTVIEGNPFDPSTPGTKRIVIGKTAGDPNPIPPERLAAWWSAAKAANNQEAARYYRLMLLTGARPGEITGALVQHANLEGNRLVLKDTKNRSDHVVLLSSQAAEIVAAQAAGKRPTASLFGLVDGRKTLQGINDAAGVSITPHDLRATFASVAEELVSAYTLKRMLNHTLTGDVTGGHYVAKSETQLRTAWQTVADFIEPTASNTQ